MSTVESHLEALREILDEVPPEGDLPEEIDEILADAQEVLEQLKLEYHTIKAPDQKQYVLTQIKKYDQTINGIKTRALMGSDTQSFQQYDNPADNERHHRNMTRLHQARQQLYDSEVTQAETIENLDQQTETMHRINDHLKQTDQELTTSNKLLNHMGKWWRP